jgi:hypothetical protein
MNKYLQIVNSIFLAIIAASLIFIGYQLSKPSYALINGGSSLIDTKTGIRYYGDGTKIENPAKKERIETFH